jgi:hypothetical protein
MVMHIKPEGHTCTRFPFSFFFSTKSPEMTQIFLFRSAKQEDNPRNEKLKADADRRGKEREQKKMVDHRPCG